VLLLEGEEMRDTIDMAREAGDEEWNILIKQVMKHFPDEVDRLVDLVRADEREQDIQRLSALVRAQQITIDKLEQALAAPVQEPVKLRRGNVLRCIETDELCTVWATSTTHKTLVKWGGNDFSDYTAEQIGELFWLEPESIDVEIAAEQSDNYAAFHAGVRFARAHLFTTPKHEEVEIDWPDYHEQGMGCGLEDRGITDRYEAMRYGWDEALGKAVESVNLLGPLYTTPPAAQRQWVGLTDDELSGIYNQADWDTVNGWEYERAIEAKLKEKNT
jgi:hypothetical protein